MTTQTESKLETFAGNAFLDDLLAFIEETEVEEAEVDLHSSRFTVETMDQANYVIRKLNEVREERGQAEQAAAEQIQAYKEKVENWLKAVSSPLDNQEMYYMNLLKMFAANKLDGSKKKSLKLIEGTLAFKKQQPDYQYQDDVLTEYLKESHPDLIAIKHSPKKAELKKAGEARNGALYVGEDKIPGVTVIDRDDKFEVK